MECVHCGSSNLKEEFSYTNFDEQTPNNLKIKEKKIFTCEKCNLIFCANVSPQELDNYYKIYENLNNDEKKKQLNTDLNWAPFNSRFFSQFLYFLQYANRDKINSVLEIGPNWQGILPTIKFFKNDIKYFFFDQINSESMKKNGGIQLGTYFDPYLKDLPKIDLVWMSHSLEHIQPELLKPTLKKIYESLNPGGYLFIEIPDNVKEKVFNFPHTLFFKEDTLIKILKKHDFNIICSQSIAKNPVETPIKLHSNEKPQIKKNLFLKMLKDIIKSFLTKKFKQKMLVNYAVKNINGPYSDRPNIRIIVQK